MDYWQHPEETLKLKGGDCEDAMLLFSSLLPSDLKNVKIVWGYIYTLRGDIYKHVWGNIMSKEGNKYVLINSKRNGWHDTVSELNAQRFFSKREIIISMTQKTFNEVIDYLKDVKDFDEDVFEEVIKFVPDADVCITNRYELHNIFGKLHGVYSTKTEKS